MIRLLLGSLGCRFGWHAWLGVDGYGVDLCVCCGKETWSRA